jgi:hypothetical protein
VGRDEALVDIVCFGFGSTDFFHDPHGRLFIRMPSATPTAGPVERFRNYCDLIKVARSGFLWEKTTKGHVASLLHQLRDRS